MFGLLVVRGHWRALSPIFHGGNEKTGATLTLNKIRFVMEDGDYEDIPFVSGNAIRGYLRRLVMKDFLDLTGYEIDVSRKSGQRLYHALFTGGVLETVEGLSGGAIDVDLKRRIVQLLFPVRLFGFSIGNQMVESKLKVHHAYPVCRELKPFLPDNLDPKCSFYDLITTLYQTRRDELRAEREEGEQAVQMLVEYEAFAPGTVFYHEFRLEDPEPIDVSCLARAIELWKKKPYIGGKSSIGFGEIQLNYEISETSERYVKAVEENKEEIVKLLEELEGR